MLTGEQTTYILLSKGDEDKRLYEEIERIIQMGSSRKEFYMEFPMLGNLYHGLRNEITSGD